MGIGGKINGTTSDFFYSIKRPAGVPLSSSPLSGVYSGHFWMKFNPPRKISENRMHIIFTLKDGIYTVSGTGSNKLGPYVLQGTYDPLTTELTCIRIYKVEQSKVKRTSVRTETIMKETRSSNRLVSKVKGLGNWCGNSRMLSCFQNFLTNDCHCRSFIDVVFGRKCIRCSFISPCRITSLLPPS